MSMLRQRGKTYAQLGLVLGLPLVFLLVFGLLRSSFDPHVADAPLPSASALPSAAVAIPQWGKEQAIEPPRLTTAVPPLPPQARELPLVTLTATSLFLGDTYVTGAPGSRPADKFRGPTELRIAPLHAMLEALPKVHDPDGVRLGGVRLLVFEEAPYRAFVEVLYTLGQTDHSTIYLLARGPGQEGLTTAVEWRAGRPWRPRVDVLAVDVLLLPDGAALRTGKGPVGPGCAAGNGVTLPGATRENVAAEVKACAEKLARQQPESAGPFFTVTALPSTPVRLVYEALLGLSAPTGSLEPSTGSPALLLPVTTSVEAWQSEPRGRSAPARDARTPQIARPPESALEALFASQLESLLDAGAPDAAPSRAPRAPSKGAPKPGR